MTRNLMRPWTWRNPAGLLASVGLGIVSIPYVAVRYGLRDLVCRRLRRL